MHASIGMAETLQWFHAKIIKWMALQASDTNKGSTRRCGSAAVTCQREGLSEVRCVLPLLA